MYAKNARGRMARWIVENRIDDPDALEAFAGNDYRYDAGLSSEDERVFVRDARDAIERRV
jgi:cytoplasmic iron level regulating protein YaaA (DUF328/UPF0246 family)